jgi:hypothetical protein
MIFLPRDAPVPPEVGVVDENAGSARPMFPRWCRIVTAIILLVLGIPSAIFFAFGSLFVAGAVQRGVDPSITWRSLLLIISLALAGVGATVAGIVILLRTSRPAARGFPVILPAATTIGSLPDRATSHIDGPRAAPAPDAANGLTGDSCRPRSTD